MRNSFAVAVFSSALVLAACGPQQVETGSGGGSATGGGDGSGGGTNATGGGTSNGGGSASGGGTSTGGGSATGGGSSNGGGTGTGGGGASTGGGGGSSGRGLPCDVQTMVDTHCGTCHGTVPSQSAPMALVTRADFLAASTSYPGQNQAQRSLTRMQASVAPMPPAPNAPVPANDLSVFQAWVNNNEPQGSCGTGGGSGTGGGTGTGGGSSTGGGTGTGGGAGGTGGGSGGGGGSTMPVCTSGISWALGNLGTDLMNPGLACRACHLGNNFNNQNPTHASRASAAYFFMGTVYPTFHETDLCDDFSANGASIQIIDANGQVAMTLTPNTVGNFHSNSTSAGIALPYTAQVVQNGKTRAMTTPQMDGDCNTCHTVMGLNNAPGRIALP